jgi:hypothetical protein
MIWLLFIKLNAADQHFTGLGLGSFPLAGLKTIPGAAKGAPIYPQPNFAAPNAALTLIAMHKSSNH